MYLVEIATISKNITAGAVYYTSHHPYHSGTGVRFRIRGRVIHGVILECAPVAQKKQFIRSLSYSLRALEPDEVYEVFTEAEMKILHTIAESLMTSRERLVRALVPTDYVPIEYERTENHRLHPIQVISPHDIDMSMERFAHIYPTKKAALEARKNNGLRPLKTSQKHQRDPQIQSGTGTLSEIFYARTHSTIVIHDPLSQLYHTHDAPHISRAWVFVHLLQARGIPVILASDIPLSGYDYNTSKPQSLDPGRFPDTVTTATDAVHASTSYVATHHEPILWWHERVGIGSLRCSVCGHMPICESCSGNFHYNGTTLICATCNSSRTPHDFCPVCTAPIIIHIPGIERVKELCDAPDNLTIITSGSIEKLSGQYHRILVPLLSQQLRIPHFETLARVLYSLFILDRHGTLVFTRPVADMISGTSWHSLLKDDYHMRRTLNLPPWGGYLSLRYIIPRTKEGLAMRILDHAKDSLEPHIIRGSHWIRIRINQSYTVSSQHTIQTTIHELQKLGDVSGQVYPLPNPRLLPFF